MKNFFKSKFGTILVLIATVALAGIAIFTAFRLYKLRQEAIAPSAPTSKPGAATCTEQCPGSDGVLRNCTPPESDGSAQESVCNSTFAGTRIESCGSKQYCCSASGWTTNMTACQSTSCTALSFNVSAATTSPTATPTSTASSSPTATPTATPASTSRPTTSPTTQATLPEAGTSLPSILGLGAGATLLIISLLLAL